MRSLESEKNFEESESGVGVGRKKFEESESGVGKNFEESESGIFF